MRCSVRGHKHIAHTDSVFDIEELLNSDILTTQFSLDSSNTATSTPSSLTSEYICSAFDSIIKSFSN